MSRECRPHGRDVEPPLDPFREDAREALRPKDVNATGGERAADQRPISLDEAHRTSYRHAADDLANQVGLLQDALEQLGAASAADKRM
ncbi:hypothetical protein NOCA2480083 [metagenome]|uniref:Uncharacterized protein n=1 Tax=metagenome TaxID=256318 RepID=A0A2P2C7U0_9ZZZZ